MTIHQPIAVADHLDRDEDSETASWYRTLEAREMAKAAYKFHDINVFQPLDAILEEITARPELAFEVTTEHGRTSRFSLGANELHKFDNHPSPAVRERAAAHRQSWMRFLAARKYIGWDTASTELDRLCGEQCDLESELITMPAPDLAALRWKLEHLFGPERREPGDFCPSWCASYMNAILADAARLMATCSGVPQLLA